MNRSSCLAVTAFTWLAAACSTCVAGSGTSGGPSGSGGRSAASSTTTASSTGSTKTAAGSSGAVSTTGGSSAGAGSTGGSSTSASSTGGATGGPSSAGTSSSGTSTGATSFSGFTGSWDTNWAQVTLLQTAGSSAVSGSYRQWGRAPSDGPGAGLISGSVTGNVLTGTFTPNAGTAGSVTWTLDSSATVLSGSWSWSGGPWPWCGIRTGVGPLPNGCGWSDTFNGQGSHGPVVITQTADEVSGTCGGGTLAGVVSDFRLNGFYDMFGATGRFSLAMSLDNSVFSGNYSAPPGPAYPWCGGRQTTAAPTSCLGGGGPYDGTWFTNLGTITLSQSLDPSNAQPSDTVAGLWFFYGTTHPEEYTFDAGLDPVSGGLSWTDSSVIAGGQNLVVAVNGNSLTLTGRTNDGTNTEWCGVSYSPDEVNSFTADPIGALPYGCGLSNDYLLWQPSVGANPTNGSFTQTRGKLFGYADAARTTLVSAEADTLAAPTAGAPVLRFVGTWSFVANPQLDGGFTWYPDLPETSFSGDYGAGLAWCGALAAPAGSMPSPCDQ